MFDAFLLRTTLTQSKHSMKLKAEVQNIAFTRKVLALFPRRSENTTKPSCNILRLVYLIATVFFLFLAVAHSGNPYQVLDNSLLSLPSPINKTKHKFMLVVESLKRVVENCSFKLNRSLGLFFPLRRSEKSPRSTSVYLQGQEEIG